MGSESDISSVKGHGCLPATLRYGLVHPHPMVTSSRVYLPVENPQGQLYESLSDAEAQNQQFCTPHQRVSVSSVAPWSYTTLQMEKTAGLLLGVACALY